MNINDLQCKPLLTVDEHLKAIKGLIECSQMTSHKESKELFEKQAQEAGRALLVLVTTVFLGTRN